MSTTAPRPPKGRYGNDDRFAGSSPRTDRHLRAAAVVCGVLFIGLIAWLSTSYLLQETKLYGDVPSFEVVSDTAVQAHLSVRKDDGVSGVCTLRSQSADGGLAGQVDVAVPAEGSTFDKVVTIRTVRTGTTAQLLGCVAHD